MRLRVLLVCVTLLPMAAALAGKGSYPRGDLSNTGVIKGKGPTKEPKVVWSQEEASDVMGPAAVLDGRVFYAVGNNAFLCRDASTGKELWSKKVKQAILSAPLAVGKFLYVGGQDSVHYRIEVANGNEPPYADDARGPIIAAPAVTGTHYLNGSLDGFFYALSVEDGRLLWRFETGPVHHAAAVAKRALFVVNERGTLIGLDLKKGSELWRFEAKADPVGPPMLDGKSILLPVVDRLIQVNANTGESERECATPGIAVAPVLRKSILHYGTRDGEVVCYDLKKGKELGRTKVGDRAISTGLVQAGNLIYGAADEVLFAVDPSKCRIVWSFAAKAPFAPPVVADKCIYVGAGTTFYCLK